MNPSRVSASVVALLPEGAPGKTIARQLSPDEIRRGYTVCSCGLYAHVFCTEVLRRLPAGYHGEQCVTCKLWMCAVSKLNQKTP